MQSTLQIGGAVVFWKLATRTDADKLAEGLTRIGLNDFSPDPRKPLALLREALGEVMERKMIRPLGSKSGYEVVSETKGDDMNSYEHYASVKLDEGRMRFEGLTDDDERRIAACYLEFSAYITGQQIAEMLLKLVYKLGGVPLRPCGAIYWLPVDQLARWAEITAVVEQCAVKGESQLHCLQVQFDESAVRAVHEGIVADITASVDLITEQILSGDLKTRALDSKLHEATQLRAKVEHRRRAFLKSQARSTFRTRKVWCHTHRAITC